MPGISVSTGVRIGPAGVDTTPASTFFVIGSAERGPINKPRLVLSTSQFELIYGTYSSTANTSMYDAVRTFFEEGGSRCYVQRVVGTGTPTAASITIQDTASTPATILTLTAANVGAWANSSSSAPVKDGLKAITTVSGSTFSLQITYKGDTIFSGGPYADEVLVDGSTKYAKQFAVDEINGNAYAANFVTATIGGSTSSTTTATTRLFTGGTDASAVTATEVVNGLALFDYDLGAGAVAAPSFNGQTMWDGLRTHAVANRRIALCAFASGTTSANAYSTATGAGLYYGTTSTAKTQGSYMAFYWPWVKIPDGVGGTRDISPEGYVAAVRARAHRAAGPWRAAAGEISIGRYVTDINDVVTRSTGDTLDANRVNAIRIVGGQVRIYGARSVSVDEVNFRFITYRDVLNYITAQCETALEPLVFQPIDARGNVFGQVEGVLTGLMEPIRKAGGVFEGIDPVTGDTIDSGYSVVCNSSNNPVTLLTQGLVTASVGARVSPVADKIRVTITKSTLNAAV